MPVNPLDPSTWADPNTPPSIEGVQWTQTDWGGGPQWTAMGWPTPHTFGEVFKSTAPLLAGYLAGGYGAQYAGASAAGGSSMPAAVIDSGAIGGMSTGAAAGGTF